MNKKTNQGKMKTVLTLIAIISSISLLFTALSSYASYPTTAHRDVYERINVMTTEAATSSDLNAYDKLLASKEFKNLNESKENIYSNRASIVSGIANIILMIALIIATYRYLRAKRVVASPVATTVWIDVAASVITLPASLLIGYEITGYNPAGDTFTLLLLLGALPFGIAFSALITFVIAKISEWHYNRSHGFLAE